MVHDVAEFLLAQLDSRIPSKARGNLGWRHEISFETLVADMVEPDSVVLRDERKTP